MISIQNPQKLGVSDHQFDFATSPSMESTDWVTASRRSTDWVRNKKSSQKNLVKI